MSLDFTIQFEDQFRIRLIAKLIKGISRVLQDLIRYFNGTIISTSFVLSLPVFRVILFNFKRISSRIISN